MARKKFDEAFRTNATGYCKEHPEKTIKQCAADLGIGYSTLRRWINEGNIAAEDKKKESVESQDEKPTLELVKEVEEQKVAEPVVEEIEKAELETQPVDKKEEVVEEKVEEVQIEAPQEQSNEMSDAVEPQPTTEASSDNMTVDDEQTMLTLYCKKAVLTVKEQIIRHKIKKLLK